MFPCNLIHARITSTISSSLLCKAIKFTLEFISFRKQLLYLIFKILQQSKKNTKCRLLFITSHKSLQHAWHYQSNQHKLAAKRVLWSCGSHFVSRTLFVTLISCSPFSLQESLENSTAFISSSFSSMSLANLAWSCGIKLKDIKIQPELLKILT